MIHVVFVAPILMPATLRFVRAIAALDGIRFGLISHSSVHRLPDDLRERVGFHYQVANCLDAGQLAIAAKSLSERMGGIHRLFGSLEELQVPVGKVRDFLGIEGMSAATAQNFRDKSRMKSVLRANKVPCARHCLAVSAEEARSFARTVDFPLVVKPPAGAGARNTFQLDSEPKLEDYLAVSAPNPGEPTLLEEFIKGEEHSFETVSIDGKPVWHSLTRYYPNPLEVLKNPWIQWCVLLPREIDHPQFDDIRLANRQALAALGMKTGLTHMEWFRREDGSLAISEVGARPPGAQIMTLMSYAHNVDFYRAWAELMVFSKFEPPQRTYAAGAAFLRGQGQGRVKAVHGIGQAQKEVGSIVIEAKLPQIGQHSRSSYEGDGYVIVRHPDTEVVKQALLRLVSLIRVSYS